MMTTNDVFQLPVTDEIIDKTMKNAVKKIQLHISFINV